MKKIKVFSGNQPCLDITTSNMTVGPNVGRQYGLNRDRNPDRDWPELRNTIMDNAKDADLTSELKQILIEDLAYAYGSDSIKFRAKMKEFNLI